MSVAIAPATTGTARPGRAARLALATVMLGAFMSLLDTTIVNVALPSMQHALRAGDGALEWVVSGYALAFGLALIPACRLGDAIGRKPLYIGGLLVFLAASLGAWPRVRPNSSPPASSRDWPQGSTTPRSTPLSPTSSTARTAPGPPACSPPSSACPPRSGRWLAGCSSPPAAPATAGGSSS